MGGRGGAGEGRGSALGQRGGGGRLELTRDRLEGRERQSVGSGEEVLPEEARASVRVRAREIGSGQPERAGVFARPADEEVQDEGEAVEPVATVRAQAAHTAALQSHRVGSGRRASGFEPQQNTFFACGRPAQVIFSDNQEICVFKAQLQAWLIGSNNKRYRACFGFRECVSAVIVNLVVAWRVLSNAVSCTGLGADARARRR